MAAPQGHAACPCCQCSPHLYFTHKVKCAPGSAIARLIGQHKDNLEVWNFIMPLFTVGQLHRLMCVSSSTNAQIGKHIQKEIRERSKCTHIEHLETGILHCFTLRAVFRFSDCLRCGAQAHWHTKRSEEVEFEERREPFPPRMVKVWRQGHRGNVRVARRDLTELADRLNRFTLE